MTIQSPDYRQLFDAAAETYDTYASGIGWTPNAQLADVLTAVQPPENVATVLDLGTGTGQSLDVVHQHFPQATLTGVDLSPAMLERAASRLPSARLAVADVVDYVARLNDSFDLVTAIGCTEFVADLPTMLAQLRPHVHGGGWVAVTIEVAGPAARAASVWTAADVLEPLAGFGLIEHRRFRAYRRADADVIYELMLLQAPAPVR